MMKEYLTKTEIKERGWSESQIKQLGQPDKLHETASGYTAHLFLTSKVLSVEESVDWKQLQRNKELDGQIKAMRANVELIEQYSPVDGLAPLAEMPTSNHKLRYFYNVYTLQEHLENSFIITVMNKWQFNRLQETVAERLRVIQLRMVQNDSI